VLDLGRLTAQIHALGEAEAEVLARGGEALGRARRELSRATEAPEPLAEKTARAKTSWLVARLDTPPGVALPAPALPGRHTVLGVDGSQIEPDHHEGVAAFVLNVGTVVLHYGEPGPEGPRSVALLESLPRLFHGEADVSVTIGGRRVPVQGELLGLKRSLEELDHLVRLARAARADGREAVVGLVDGSLIRWGAENAQAVPEGFLEEYLARFERLRELDVPLAGYISQSRSADLVNALRVQICPEHTPSCDRCPYVPGATAPRADAAWAGPGLPCEVIAGVLDRRLVEGLLGEAERTPCFGSRSKVLARYGDHAVEFFYLHVGPEVARLEVPRWVARDPERLGLVHAVVADQARKGQGYPVALAEAHQRAVVRGAERALFFDLVEEALARRGVRRWRSPKVRHKSGLSV
jgi:hypothetical protein